MAKGHWFESSHRYQVILRSLRGPLDIFST